MDDRINDLIEAMRKKPCFFEYSINETDVRLLIEDLKTVQERCCLTAGELSRIAQIKSPRRAELVKENHNDEITELTKCAFSVASSSPIAAAAILTALQGVGVPTASAILAWTFPSKFGVIDRRAWATLQKFKIMPESNAPKTSFSLADWRSYHEWIIKIAAKASEGIGGIINPQAVDLWLYRSDRDGTHASG